jgi:serine protease Do
LKESGGVLVADVIDGTPAQKAGLRDGDVILGIAGEDVRNSNELSRRVASFPPGEKVALKVHREGKIRNFDVTLGQRDETQTAAAQDIPSNDNDSLARDVGLRVSDLNQTLRQQFRVPDNVNGVVVTGVRPGSPAQEAGLQPGVVILQVDGENVTSSNDLRAKIDNAKSADKDAVLLRMQFGANRQFGALSLDRE